jgi:hypothetical protein
VGDIVGKVVGERVKKKKREEKYGRRGKGWKGKIISRMKVERGGVKKER